MTNRRVEDHYKYFSSMKHPYMRGSIVVISNVSKTSVSSIVKNCNVRKGDLLYFVDKNQTIPSHATIIVRVYNRQIYYAGHSNSRWNYNLCKSAKNKKVIIVRIKNGVR